MAKPPCHQSFDGHLRREKMPWRRGGATLSSGTHACVLVNRTAVRPRIERMAHRPKRVLSSAAYAGIVVSLIPPLSMHRIVADKQYQGGYTLGLPHRRPLPCAVL